jgi:hypothetical protein
MAVPACSVSKYVLPSPVFSTMFMHTSSLDCHQETRVARSAPSCPLLDVCSSYERCRLDGDLQRACELQRLVSMASEIPRHLPCWLQYAETCGAFGTRLSWMLVRRCCTPSPRWQAYILGRSLRWQERHSHGRGMIERGRGVGSEQLRRPWWDGVVLSEHRIRQAWVDVNAGYRTGCWL